MSLSLALNRSVYAREAIKRCLSSSRTILKLKTSTNQVAQSMKFAWLPKKNAICTPFIRSFSISKEEEKEERREKRHELVEKEKKSVINFGHKFNQMGGTKVVVAYFGLELACLAGFYGSFKLGLVSPDTIVALMNKWEFTSRYSHIIMNNPNASLFTLAYLCNKAIAPIRMALITGYGTYVVEKNKKRMKKSKCECDCNCGKGKCGCGKGECECGKGNCECGKGEGKGECQCKKGEGKGECGKGKCNCKRDDCKCKKGEECECKKDGCKCKKGEKNCGCGNGNCKHGNGSCKHGNGNCKHKEEQTECIVGVME